MNLRAGQHGGNYLAAQQVAKATQLPTLYPARRVLGFGQHFIGQRRCLMPVYPTGFSGNAVVPCSHCNAKRGQVYV